MLVPVSTIEMSARPASCWALILVGSSGDVAVVIPTFDTQSGLLLTKSSIFGLVSWL